MAALAQRGFGAYPGDPCYDPNRPSWLPYWIDDFTESECKYGATSIGGAIVGAFEDPATVSENVGGVIGQGAGAAVGDVISGAAAAVGGAAAGTVNNTSLSGALLIGAAVLLGILYLVKMK